MVRSILSLKVVPEKFVRVVVCVKEASFLISIRVKRFCIDTGGRLPVLQVEGGVFGEENGELTAFRPDPEPVLAAEDVDVRSILPEAINSRFTQPSQTVRSRCRAGHHAALICRATATWAVPSALFSTMVQTCLERKSTSSWNVAAPRSVRT